MTIKVILIQNCYASGSRKHSHMQKWEKNLNMFLLYRALNLRAEHSTLQFVSSMHIKFHIQFLLTQAETSLQSPAGGEATENEYIFSFHSSQIFSNGSALYLAKQYLNCNPLQFADIFGHFYLDSFLHHFHIQLPT